jgi:nucleotide-binding universal stress UspA family protein
MAATLAEKHQAHLEASVVVPLFQPSRGANDRVFAEVVEAVRKRQREEAAEAVAHLRSLTAVADPERLTVHTLETSFEDVRMAAARAALTADIILLGQPERLDGDELDTEIFVGALMGGGRPCLMLPRWIEPHAWGRRVMIAWKATPEAARAVQAALPLIACAEAVRVCCINPRGEERGEGPSSLARLATYLTRHGARVEDAVTIESWEGPEKAFPAEIEGFGADLLVMGAYSRSRLQELLFGGMTAAMVRTSKMPLLLMR